MLGCRSCDRLRRDCLVAPPVTRVLRGLIHDGAIVDEGAMHDTVTSVKRVTDIMADVIVACVV